MGLTTGKHCSVRNELKEVYINDVCSFLMQWQSRQILCSILDQYRRNHQSIFKSVFISHRKSFVMIINVQIVKFISLTWCLDWESLELNSFTKNKTKLKIISWRYSEDSLVLTQPYQASISDLMGAQWRNRE